METRERKRGCLGRVAVFFLAIMALLGLATMALSVVNGYINPQHFIWTTVFGLAFWEILFFNVVVFLLLLLLWSKWAWISVVALLISIPGINRSFAFNSKKEAVDSIRVMSYNLHNFNHVDGDTEKEVFANSVMDMVQEKMPDILCCQEFAAYKSSVSRPKCIEDFAKGAGFQYVYYNRKNNYGGNVIFSKYPLTKISEDSDIGKEKTYGIMVEVDAGDKGKFYVANIHLLSYMITDNEIDILMNSSEHDGVEITGKSVLHKLSYAFQRRSEELRTVLEGLPPVDGPVIICGDFNEPPLSYNYRQMQKAGFVDTFMKAGRGIKPTYAGQLPLLRIDYVWGNDKVNPINFKRIRYKASDHYPIMLDFSLQ